MKSNGFVRQSVLRSMVFVLLVLSVTLGVVPDSALASPIPVKDYEFSALQEAAEQYVARPPRLVSTKFVYDKIVQGKSSDYWLISLCAPQDHAKGHVPEARLFPRVAFAKPQTWQKIPADKKLVSYCYTGVGSGYMTTIFTMSGYDAYSMAFGLTDWTTNAVVIVNPARPRVPSSYPVEVTANVPTRNYPLPSLNTGKLDATGIAMARGQEYLGSLKPLSIDAKEVKATLIDAGDLEKYMVIDIRKSSQYAKGHIPSAVNIPWADTMKMESLQKLPSNKTLVIVDEDGQSASMIAALYNLLGYQARVLLFGMMTWSTDPAVVGKPLWQAPSDYPLVFPAATGLR